MAPLLSPGEVEESVQESTASPEWREDRNVPMICPECKESPSNLLEKSSEGDTVCASCGLVLADRCIDETSEWRTFANDAPSDDPSRVGRGGDDLLDGTLLYTAVSSGDGSKTSLAISRTHAKMNSDKSRETLKDAFAEISTRCKTMHLPDDTILFAQRLFKSLEDAGALKGKKQQRIIAGCIYMATKFTKHTRTFKEITDATLVSKKEIKKIFTAIEKFRKKQKDKAAKDSGVFNDALKADSPATSSTDLADICRRYCNRLLLDHLSSKIAIDLARKISEDGTLSGRSPLSAAAVCIYLATHLMGQPKDLKEIAAVAGVSVGTIRSAYKLLYLKKDSLIEPKWLEDGGDLSRLPKS